MSNRPRRRGEISPAALLLLIGLGVGLLVAGYALGRRGAGSAEQPAGSGDRAEPTPVEPSAGTTPPAGVPVRTIRPAADATPLSWEFDPPAIDLGTVEMGRVLPGSSILHNRSDRPLRIVQMKASCKCTTLENHTGKTIPPGGSLAIEATIESKTYPGTSRSEIRFLFQGSDEVAVLPILAVVSRAVQAEPANLRPHEALLGSVTIRSTDGRPFRILAADGEPPIFADDYDPASGETRSEYELAWDLREYDLGTCINEQGRRMPMWWVVETDHPDAPIVDLRVRHNPCTMLDIPTGGRRWFLADNRVVLDAIRPGESAEFETYMKWVRNEPPTDGIGSVETLSDQFTAELIEVEERDGASWCRIRVTPAEGVRGLIYGDIRIHGRRSPGNAQKLVVIARVPDEDDGA